MKKILLVEDTPSHMSEGWAFLKSQEVEVVTATNASEAYAILGRFRSKKLQLPDGVITDLYLPHCERAPHNNPELPCGLGVAMLAKSLQIPVVICTAGYHHGGRYEWIFTALMESKFARLVDPAVTPEGFEARQVDGDHKNWAEAWSVLNAEMNLL